MSTPVEVAVGRVWLTYWPDLGQLQIAKSERTARGRVRARTVNLGRDDLAGHPEALDLIGRFLEEAGRGPRPSGE